MTFTGKIREKISVDVQEKLMRYQTRINEGFPANISPLPLSDKPGDVLIKQRKGTGERISACLKNLQQNKRDLNQVN